MTGHFPTYLTAHHYYPPLSCCPYCSPDHQFFPALPEAFLYWCSVLEYRISASGLSLTAPSGWAFLYVQYGNLPMTGWYTGDRDGLIYVTSCMYVCIHHTLGWQYYWVTLCWRLIDTLAVEALYLYMSLLCPCPLWHTSRTLPPHPQALTIMCSPL